MRPANPHARTGGTTLVELVLALAVTSILLAGMGSAMVVAIRSVPDPDGPAEARRRVNDALRQLAGELAIAWAVPEQSATGLTLVLPDRDGDGFPETVRWWREDSAGAPLLRQLSGDAAEEVSGPIAALNFNFVTSALLRELPGVPDAGSEELLADFSPTGVDRELDVEDDERFALPLLPDLPPDAVAWEATRVDLRLSQGDPGGNLAVRFHRWFADHEGDTELAAVDVPEAQMSVAPAWTTLDLGATGADLRLPAGALLVAILQPAAVSAEEAARLTVAEEGTAFADSMRTWDGVVDPPWPFEETRRGLHRVYGKVFTPGTPWSREDRWLGQVETLVTLIRGGEVRANLSTGASPPSAGWLRRTSFDPGPSAFDLDLDGVADFTPAIPAGELQNGVWNVQLTGGLSATGSAAGLPGPTRLRLRVRDKTAGDAGGTCVLRFGRGAGSESVIAFNVRGDNEEQSLSLGTVGAGPTVTSWIEVQADSQAWIDLDLSLDPANDRVSVHVDGLARGSFPVTPEPDDASAADLTLTTERSGFEIDALEIHGGEGS